MIIGSLYSLRKGLPNLYCATSEYRWLALISYFNILMPFSDGIWEAASASLEISGMDETAFIAASRGEASLLKPSILA